MKKIAFVNHKGGVGKTACSMAFAECLHAQGKKTLLIDLDQQMNATQIAGINSEGIASVYDLMTSDGIAIEEAIVAGKHGDIVPGDRLMIGAERDMRDLMSPYTRLDDLLRDLPDDAYDYVVIDCPPSLGYVTTNAMVAADELVVVVNPDRASITGVGSVYELARKIAANPRLNPALAIAGLLVNNYNYNRRLSRTIDAELPDLARMCGTKVFRTRIRSCEAVRKAQSHGESVLEYDPEGNAARDFRQFVAEYEEGTGE